MTDSDIIIEPAATIILVKDTPLGPKVLMQQRNPEAIFVGGAWVFPGGKLDKEDYDERWPARCQLNPDNANRLLDVGANAHAYWVGAIRELVEEAGVLLAENASPALALAAQQFLSQHPDQFHTFCQSNNIELSGSALRYLSRWITPEGNPKRYDTRFFLTLWPEGQVIRQDDHEAVNTCWIRPEDALEHHKRDEWVLVLPTLTTLQQLCGYRNCAELLANNGRKESV